MPDLQLGFQSLLIWDAGPVDSSLIHSTTEPTIEPSTYIFLFLLNERLRTAGGSIQNWLRIMIWFLFECRKWSNDNVMYKDSAKALTEEWLFSLIVKISTPHIGIPGPIASSSSCLRLAGDAAVMLKSLGSSHYAGRLGFNSQLPALGTSQPWHLFTSPMEWSSLCISLSLFPSII